jgi:ribonuclease P protein component
VQISKEILSIKKRVDFQRITNEGTKSFAKSMIIFICNDNNLNDNLLQLGLIVSKKNGNAVKRNRIKRRLRAAVKALKSNSYPMPKELVILAKKEILDRDFKTLTNDLIYTLKKCNYHLNTSH